MEPLDFAQAFEGLFERGLRDHFDDRLKAKLKDAGVDFSKPLDPAYPSAVLVKCITIAAEHVFAGQPRERAINATGHAFFRGYTDTMIGRAMLGVMRLIGPRRSLERMQRNFRTGNNYIESRFEVITPLHVRLWIKPTSGMPSYFQGIIEEGAMNIGAKNTVVAYQDEPDGSTRYDVTWEESGHPQQRRGHV